MIVCRHKKSGRLVDVYAGTFEFLTSCDYLYHLEHCNVVDKWPCDLLQDEYTLAKEKRMV